MNIFRRTTKPNYKISDSLAKGVTLFVYILSSFFSFVSFAYAKDIEDVISSIYKFVIALGVFLAIFLIPYIAVLFASGSPENLKKGKEWLFSLISGLILIFLSSIIIKIVGQELFGL